VNLESIAKAVEDRAKDMETLAARSGGSPFSISVAVMGCAVNGPGEAANADIGVACGEKKGVIFQKGEILKTVAEEDVVEELMKGVERVWMAHG
jgi:(E)-4-hydroxy-3-methylbut-2-enyl-diphosphate synthase